MARQPVVSLERVQFQKTPMRCFLYARRGMAGSGDLMGSRQYNLSKELREEIKLTADILGISVEEANVKRVGRRPDDYIFVYKQHIKCSDADLNTLEVFMNFEEEVVATNAAATTSATATNSATAINSATSLKLEPFM
ncbi:hypothetical protein GBAR_LOCUS16932 [Geodia barretti]|nr:hypothetical protein GBAR_LOCUS16932 [Geodia barretti]